MMHRQALWGAVGVLLSCLLTVFGWFFTVALLTQNETTLLSQSGTMELTRKAPGVTQGAPDDNSDAYTPATLAEIVHILRVWETQSNLVPHEPSNGQLTMEQAVAAGSTWLKRFSAEAAFPSFPDDTKINAFLAANEPALSALVSVVPAELGTIRQQEELAPYFSYWTVRFQQEQYDATLIVNAATGQIWHAEIKLSTPEERIDIDVEKVLSGFLETLALPEDEILVRDGQTASHSFGNGALLAVAETTSTADMQTIKIYLTTE